MVQASYCGPNPRITGFCVTPSVTERLQARVRDRSHPNVTPTSRKIPVTTAPSSKIAWQAGMSKRMSHVRSYVLLPVTEASGYTEIPDENLRKTEKYSWHPGMYKGMNSLAGYVACRDRDNWDFREILH
jgi:hypothetical protein